MKGQRKVFLFSARRDTWRTPSVSYGEKLSPMTKRFVPLRNTTALVYTSKLFSLVFLLPSVPSLLFCGPGRGSKKGEFSLSLEPPAGGVAPAGGGEGANCQHPDAWCEKQKKIVNILVIYFLSANSMNKNVMLESGEQLESILKMQWIYWSGSRHIPASPFFGRILVVLTGW